MKLYFCTYYDSRYLPRALVMLDSLFAVHPDIEVFVVAMDELAGRETKARYGTDSVKVIPISQIEDPDLLLAKKERTTVEYYWTCTPSIILYCLEHNEILIAHISMRT